MKKLGVLLVGIFLVGLVAGCIGEKESTSMVTQTPTHSTQVTSTTHSETSETMTVTKTSTPSSAKTFKPKTCSREDLLKSIEKIERFKYSENLSVTFNVKVRQGNMTLNAGELSIISKKVGYVDLINREADINTTTTAFPAGSKTFTREIIKNGNVYLYSHGTWQKLTNETLNPEVVLNLTWEYNAVSFVKKYLRKEPFNETFENGTQILYYNITEEDLSQLGRLFVGFNANVTYNVTDGVLEVLFRNCSLAGGRIAYNMVVHIFMKDPQGELVEIIETGKSYEEFILRDINIKKNVQAPKNEISA